MIDLKGDIFILINVVYGSPLMPKQDMYYNG